MIKKYINLPYVYCILITGKNKDRYKYIDLALKNFNEQTYKNKILIIINHGEISLKHIQTNNIHEIQVSKENFTLGDLRNLALDLVPFNALWTVWDDDDYRHKKYIEVLVKYLTKNNADVVFFKNRIDFNIHNKFMYRSKFEYGMPFILSKKIDNIKYLSKDSLEDIRLYNDYELNNKKILVINNDPRWYIRTIHNTNTSLYVDNNRSDIINYSDESLYHEFELTQKEIKYVQTIYNNYFITIK